MKQRLEKIFAQGFQDLQQQLLQRIAASLEPVEAWLRSEQEAERQHPPAPDPYLDERILRGLLREINIRSKLSHAEWERLEEVRARIDTVRAQIQDQAPAPLLLDQNDPAQIQQAFETHYGYYAELFRDLRILDLSLAGEYLPELHDSALSAFSWKELTDREMALIPPLVVFLATERPLVETTALALKLLTTGLPLKLLALQQNIQTPRETGRALAHRFHPDLGFFGLSLRSAYVLQATEDIESFDQEVMAALRSPRPALLSLWDGTGDDPRQSQLALASRVFPYLRYDPELGLDCTSCLEIGKNPHPETAWVSEILPLPGGGEEERPLTFAEFAWHVLDQKEEFAPLNEPGPENPSLADYLEMETDERHHLRPYILVSEAGETRVLLPSNNILYQCQDRMRLWRSLQSLAGADQPSEDAAVAAREDSPQEIAGRIAAEREQAVAQALQTLSRKLLGLEEMELALGGEDFKLDLRGLDEALSSSGTAPPATGAAGPSDLPWIETKLCTACDECTNINKRIFVYDKEKQAVIKNPRGGPFRDIVKAAEKCSAAIIHPGKPLDPKEKDLAKWIKRAEKYQ